MKCMEEQTNEVKKLALANLNKLFKETSQYFNLEYKLLIYRLLKKGHAKVSDLSEDSGLSTTRLYQIVDEVNKFQDEGGVTPDETV